MSEQLPDGEVHALGDPVNVTGEPPVGVTTRSPPSIAHDPASPAAEV
ncbi:hypothetical protein PHK61_14645 [Actinomycetospora lutea]|nr:hypothetical protein [Actinomycetospora lutea]MDD7939660.1 hypothetical protein [Actinomycetospora lutea]